MGGCYVAAEARTTKLCLARINQYGALDPSFDGGVGGNGQIIFAPSGGSSLGNAVALRPMAASSSRRRAPHRPVPMMTLREPVQGDPYTGVRCTMDIDGDGVIAATTDGLLFSRAAMGLTGTAVTNGITFAANCNARGLSSIRDYLNLHCGTRTGR